MIIVAGCLIVKNNKVLMVKEANEKVYGQWNLPAGQVDEHELITDAAIREAYEETGCKVKLTGVLSVSTVILKNGKTVIRMEFTADIVEENIEFDTNEILDVQWIDIEQIKNMSKQELRGYDSIMQSIRNFENKKIYPLEIFDQKIYVRG